LWSGRTNSEAWKAVLENKVSSSITLVGPKARCSPGRARLNILGTNAFNNEMRLKQVDSSRTTISFVGVFASSNFVSGRSTAGKTNSARNALIETREAALSRTRAWQLTISDNLFPRLHKVNSLSCGFLC
jgi:hypothetical protein